MRPTLAFILLLVPSCFNADTSNTTILCPNGEQCPEGTTCLAGVCTASGSDAGLSDQGSDGMPDQMSISGCKPGLTATAVGQAFACSGSFSAGGASDQCASGWRLCGQLTQVDAAACAGLGGFFVADQPAYWLGTMSSEACGGASSNQLFYGCGRDGRAGTSKCGGFLSVIDLGTSFTSSNGSVARLANSRSDYGALCCR